MFERIRAFFDARKVSRWSLYFVHKHEGLTYALHDNAVDILLGYVLAPIKTGKKISPDWELHLNFNFEHKSIRLVEAFFVKGDISSTLRDLIAKLDPGWMVPRGELVFVDTRTRKELPLESPDPSRRRDDKDAYVTLASVMRKVIY